MAVNNSNNSNGGPTEASSVGVHWMPSADNTRLASQAAGILLRGGVWGYFGSMSLSVVVFIWVMVAGIGAVLVRAGWWPHRVGATPHCGRCDYDLTGSVSPVCPECGLELAGRRELGERRRRPALAIAGLVVIAVCLAPAIWGIAYYIRNTNWYPYALQSWLLDNLSSANGIRRMACWKELIDRDAAGRLDSAATARMIDLCIEGQSGSVRASPLLALQRDYLVWCAQKGRLSAAQTETVFENMLASLPVSLIASRRVLAGDSFGCQLYVDKQGLARGLDVRLRQVRLLSPDGGVPIDLMGRRDPEPPASGVLWSSAEDEIALQSGLLPHIGLLCHQPGKYRLVLDGTVEFREYVRASKQPGRVLYSGPLSINATVEVVTMESLNLPIVSGPEMAETLAGLIHFEHLTIGGSGGESGALPGGRTLTYWYGHEALPAAVALQVFVRVEGREYQVGSICSQDGRAQESRRFDTSYPGPRVGKVDLVLRTSPVLQQHIISLAVKMGQLPAQVWRGEIVYEGVPVRVLRE